MPAIFQCDKLLCRFNFDEKFSFQKPFGNRDIFIKVIKAKVIAIKAKDQEHSGGFLDNIVLF